MSLNIVKANTLNDKLFKCYSQIGLCDDENVLFGKGPVEKELHFLTLLTVFIKKSHLVNHEPLDNEKSIVQSERDNLNTNHVSDEISKMNNDELELKKEVKSEEFSNTLSESFKKKCDIDVLCSDIEEIKKEFDNRSHKNYEQSLQNFKSSFKNVSSLSSQSLEKNIVTEDYDNISSNLQDIHFTFLTVNKTLSNKIKIKNQPILENSTVMTETLTSVIKDNLVLVEQACNTLIED